MGSGCYDLDGRCVNCKKLHPCDCESEGDREAEQQAEEGMFERKENGGR